MSACVSTMCTANRSMTSVSCAFHFTEDPTCTPWSSKSVADGSPPRVDTVMSLILSSHGICSRPCHSYSNSRRWLQFVSIIWRTPRPLSNEGPRKKGPLCCVYVCVVLLLGPRGAQWELSERRSRLLSCSALRAGQVRCTPHPRLSSSEVSLCLQRRLRTPHGCNAAYLSPYGCNAGSDGGGGRLSCDCQPLHSSEVSLCLQRRLRTPHGCNAAYLSPYGCNAGSDGGGGRLSCDCQPLHRTCPPRCPWH